MLRCFDKYSISLIQPVHCPSLFSRRLSIWAESFGEEHHDWRKPDEEADEAAAH